MAWYWWVLIVVGLTAFVFLKVKVGGAWLKKQAARKKEKEKAMDQDD